MNRTISIKISVSEEQSERLHYLAEKYAWVCNIVARIAADNRCWNRVALHHLAYHPARETTDLGSQMCCNAIKAVCQAYKAIKPKKDKPVQAIDFKGSSTHFDKRTYSTKNGELSLYTVQGRIKVGMVIGSHQARLLDQGEPKEAELIYKKSSWYFNLVLDITTPEKTGGGSYGVDVGENNLAATSSRMIVSGKKLKHKRDKHLHLRKRLQSKGTRSAKQLLRKISGKERRHVKHVNHCISKAIVQDASNCQAGVIVLENLTKIRKKMKYGKSLNTRLHRWAWGQLQTFIAYKAEGAGIAVTFSNPAYSSKVCSNCGCFGVRDRHIFTCSECLTVQHSDFNAAKNHAQFAVSQGIATGTVNYPNVPVRLSVV